MPYDIICAVREDRGKCQWEKLNNLMMAYGKWSSRIKNCVCVCVCVCVWGGGGGGRGVTTTISIKYTGGNGIYLRALTGSCFISAKNAILKL